MGGFNHPAGDFDIFIKRFVAGINHHRTVKTTLDTIVAGFFIAMIEMNRKNGFRENLVGRSNQAFEHFLVGVRARALANLNDERGFAIHVPTKQAHRLLQIIDVISPNRILAISGFKQFFGRNNHNRTLPLQISEIFAATYRGQNATWQARPRISA